MWMVGGSEPACVVGAPLQIMKMELGKDFSDIPESHAVRVHTQ